VETYVQLKLWIHPVGSPNPLTFAEVVGADDLKQSHTCTTEGNNKLSMPNLENASKLVATRQLLPVLSRLADIAVQSEKNQATDDN